MYSALAVLVVAAFLLAGPSAGAGTSSFVVYGCSDPSGQRQGTDLCRVDLDGRGRRRLIADAQTSSDYTHPSLSAGSRPQLAFGRGLPTGGLFEASIDMSGSRPVGGGTIWRVAISPAGDRVAYVETEDPLPSEPQGSQTPVLFTVRSDGSDRRTWGRRLTDPTWLGNQLVAVLGGVDGGSQVCVLREGTGQCERTLASLPEGQLKEPAVSPDRAIVAVVAERDSPQLFPGIYLFSTKTSGRVDGPIGTNVSRHPAWSPDGRALAYGDAGAIYVQRRPPGAGGYQLVRRGAGELAWGGISGQRSPRLRVRSVVVRGRQVTIRGTIARKARAALRVEFARGGGVVRSRIFWRRAHHGRFGFRYRIPHENPADGFFSCGLFVSYPGDTTFGWGYARRVPRGGACG